MGIGSFTPGGAIADAIGPLLGPIFERLADLIPDPVARAKALAEAQERAQAVAAAADAAQMDVNKTEAASSSWFVAGWRPAIGWVGALALANQYLVVPIVPWLSQVCGYDIPVPPQLVDNQLWSLIMGLLGLGTLRTIDKYNGSETSSIRPYSVGAGRGR
jgi:Holin of 3TMs, for gene-transfer release